MAQRSPPRRRYALLEKLEEIEEQSTGELARIINKASAHELIRDKNGTVVGVHYTQAGKKFTEYGPGERRGAARPCLPRAAAG